MLGRSIYLNLFLASVAAFGLSSCRLTENTTTAIAEATPVSSPVVKAIESQPLTLPSPPPPTPIASVTTPDTTTVEVFFPDSSCEKLIPTSIEVSQTQPLEEAIAFVLNQFQNGDFSLAGYRLQVDNRKATIDLRLSPNSQRSLASLSPCENLALFGSLRRTLTANPQWQIEDVHFTEQGAEIYL